MDLNMKVVNVTLNKTIELSPDADAKKAGDKKTVTLCVKYDGLTLQDVFMKALDKDVVSWQNGSGGRKNYVNLVDKETIKVDAKAPGKAPQVDPETAMVAKLATMTPEEQASYFADLMEKAASK